jgi:hypothetical protein
MIAATAARNEPAAKAKSANRSEFMRLSRASSESLASARSVLPNFGCRKIIANTAITNCTNQE